MNDSKPLRLVPPEAEPATPKRKRSTLRDTKAKANRSKTKREECPITFEQAGELLKRPVAFHPIHAEISGSVEAGLFLGQALYWTRIQDETAPDADGWFWKTQEQWFNETGLKRSGQETSRKLLIARKLIQEERRPLPAPSFQARTYYKVNRENYLAALWKAANSQSAAMQQTRLPDGSRQERRQAANKTAAMQQTLGTENTAQTTPQSTASTSHDDANVENLIDALVSQNVTPKRAKYLAQHFPGEMRRRLEFLPDVEIKSTPAQYLSGNPSVEYSEPPERSTRLQAEAAELRAIAERRAADQRRHAEAENQTRAQDENDMLDGYYKSLDFTERKQIDEQAARRLAPLAALGIASAGALAAARRNIIRKELGMPTEDNDET
jgi:hypothetical protein